MLLLRPFQAVRSAPHPTMKFIMFLFLKILMPFMGQFLKQSQRLGSSFPFENNFCSSFLLFATVYSFCFYMILFNVPIVLEKCWNNLVFFFVLKFVDKQRICFNTSLQNKKKTETEFTQLGNQDREE